MSMRQRSLTWLCCDMSVANGPGATALTRILRGASSTASAFVICTTAPLEAAYAERSLIPINPAVDATLTIALPGFMCATAARQTDHTPYALARMTCSKSASDVACNV